MQRGSRALHIVWRSFGGARAWQFMLRRLPPRAATALEQRRLRLRDAHPALQAREQALYGTFREALELLERNGVRDGDYLEFGVFRGASLECMHRASAAARRPEMRLVGFDSFEGLPSTAASMDGGAWYAGQFRSELDATRAWLTSRGVDWARVTLVPGWFDETLTAAAREELGIHRASVVMVDCDLESAARTALEFVAPVLTDPAVVLFDDWAFHGLAERHLGERAAFDAFLRAHDDLHVDAELTPYTPEAHVVVLRRRPAPLAAGGA